MKGIVFHLESQKKRGEGMNRFCTKKRPSENGQGLVEYALILVLVSVVVLAVLLISGPTIGNVFTEVVNTIENPGGDVDVDGDDEDENDVVAITRADYSSGNVHLDATSDGVWNAGVTLTASPGGVMGGPNGGGGGHYHLNISVTCPCTVTVTSSEGGSSTVNVP